MTTRTLPGVGLLALAIAAVASAQAPKAPAPIGAVPGTAPPSKSTGISVSIDSCQACHGGATLGQASGFVKNFKSNEFVLLNESKTWGEKDVHAIAFANISEPAPAGQPERLWQRMEKLLGYKVAEATQCLTCHSVDFSPTKKQKNLAKDFPNLSVGGVNCTVCHGLGKEWQSEHYSDPLQQGKEIPWRTKDPEYKYNLGMNDLRNPSTKAQLCVSCHVGNPNEGKVVTHEMYAAGHPPLQPFELSTYMQCEPNHWGYPTDERLKFFQTYAADKPDSTWKTYRYHEAKKETYLARHLAAGAIAALQAEVRLIAAEAASADKPDYAGPDYARFDCYSCHHDLKYPSDRQKRGYEGAPGRPPLKAWVGALPSVVIEHAADLEDADLKKLAGEFAPLWESVRKEALSRPFGNPAPLAKAGAALDAWCESFLDLQTKTTAPVYTPAQSKRLLGLIGKAVETPKWTGDPEAAMTLTWAYITLRGDLGQPVPDAKLEALGKVIAVRVRSPEDYEDPDNKNLPKPIEKFLKARLDRFSRYNADEFGKAFKSAIGGE